MLLARLRERLSSTGKGQRMWSSFSALVPATRPWEMNIVPGSAVCTRQNRPIWCEEKLPHANITVFYMDVRAFGKGFEEFYDRVKQEGVRYRRGNPSEVYRKGDRLVVKAEDTLLGELVEVEADLVVLATGIVPNKETAEIVSLLKLSQSPDRFLLEAHPKLRPVDSAERWHLSGRLLPGTERHS